MKVFLKVSKSWSKINIPAQIMKSLSKIKKSWSNIKLNKGHRLICNLFSSNTCIFCKFQFFYNTYKSYDLSCPCKFFLILSRYFFFYYRHYMRPCNFYSSKLYTCCKILFSYKIYNFYSCSGRFFSYDHQQVDFEFLGLQN